MYLCILGRKGQGKTTLCRKLLSESRRAVVVDVLNEYNMPVIGIDELVALKKQSDFRVRVCCEDLAEVPLALARLPTRSLVVLDELGLYSGPTQPMPELERLYRFGRHLEVRLVAVARRPTELPRIVTALTDCWAIFKTTEPRDLAFLRASGLNISGVESLEQGEFLFFRPSGDRERVTLLSV